MECFHDLEIKRLNATFVNCLTIGDNSTGVTLKTWMSYIHSIIKFRLLSVRKSM